MKDGKGTLTSQNGSCYTGKWYQDKKHGHGEMTGSDKQVFTELWKYGVLISRKLKEIKVELSNLSVNNKSMSSSVIVAGGYATEDPMRSDSRMLGTSALDLSSSFVGTAQDKTLNEDGVTQMLDENPQIDTWTERNVQIWLNKSGLDKMEGMEAIFARNNITG